MTWFDTILIANRGEIAVRIMRACRELGIRTVAIASDADVDAYHTRFADDVVLIGPSPAAQSYLAIPAIIAAARQTGAQAIHPGYGFLSENPLFAEACAEAGIVFIGPPPSAMRLMGSKTAAKTAVSAANVPTVPGYQGVDQSLERLTREAKRIGYPVLIKASAGGGGKGMRTVNRAADLPEALAAAQREALAAFGDGTVFLEKLVAQPRHIEFQILADKAGACVHLGERECSIQRRHQKIIEESPSLALTPALREEMGAAAVRAAQAAGYVNAGTCEFLLDRDGQYYFLEMNTRLQVEHPVTEQVTGLDLVHLQIAIAAGETLANLLPDYRLTQRGHAIEVRLYAEDPATYLPSTGTLSVFDPPIGPGIRLDSGVRRGDTVSMYYDPMLAKLIVTAPNRPAAISRMESALQRFGLLGVTTNLPLLRQILQSDCYRRGETYTDFLNAPLPDIEHTGRQNLHLLAAAVYEREQAGTQVNRRSSPWTAGALRGGSFEATYQGSEQIHRIVIRAIAGSKEWEATLDGKALSLEPDMEGTWMAIREDGGTLIIRQRGKQAIFWVARDDQGDLIVTDALAIWHVRHPRPPDASASGRAGKDTARQQQLAAPMAGTIVQVRVQPGDLVEARQTLIIMTAMKMEHSITAVVAGRVKAVHCTVGAVVAGGATLVEIEGV